MECQVANSPHILGSNVRASRHCGGYTDCSDVWVAWRQLHTEWARALPVHCSIGARQSKDLSALRRTLRKKTVRRMQNHVLNIILIVQPNRVSPEARNPICTRGSYYIWYLVSRPVYMFNMGKNIRKGTASVLLVVIFIFVKWYFFQTHLIWSRQSRGSP